MASIKLGNCLITLNMQLFPESSVLWAPVACNNEAVNQADM